MGQVNGRVSLFNPLIWANANPHAWSEDHIRQALMSNSLNSTTEQFVNIHHLYKDYGNINEDAYETTEEFHETLRTRWGRSSFEFESIFF